MQDNPVERVVHALDARGRSVPADTIARQLGGLDGLPAELAADALLRTYGLTADGAVLPGFEPDRSSRDVLRDLLRTSRSSMLYVFVAAVVGLVPALAVPLLMRVFVDRYIVAQDNSWGPVIVAGLLVAAVIAGAVVALQYAALRRLQMRLSRSDSVAFTWSVLTMRIPDLQRFGSGDVLGRRLALQRFAYQGGVLLPLSLVNSMMAIAFLAMIFALDVIMGAAAILLLALVLGLSWFMLRRRAVFQVRADDERVRMSGYAADVVSSVESIKAAAWEQFAFARWATIQRSTAAALTRLGVVSQYTGLVPVLAQTLGLGAFLAIGVAQVFAGTVSLGTVVATQAYMVGLLATVALLGYFGSLLQAVSSAARQFGPILREPLDPEMLTISIPEKPRESRLQGAVSLHEVVFGYGDATEPLLKQLSLEVDAGRRIALVGPSGSGKTTIAKIIVGELRPWSGFVALDGVARLAVPRSTRTRDVAYVPQNTVLFPGTIRDNLALWDDSISDEEIARAARDACIEETILGRPGAYFHWLSSADGGFSGGELQRLAIARALASDPRIIVLDEATSALDPVVEADVESRLRARGLTAVVVAHRLSTVRDADEIFVVESGRIVQRGTFTELSREGLFAELVHG